MVKQEEKGSKCNLTEQEFQEALDKANQNEKDTRFQRFGKQRKEYLKKQCPELAARYALLF